MIEHLRNPTFETSLKVWPYALAGIPLDEVIAMVNLHRTRLTFPGLTVAEREASRLWLAERELFTWVPSFTGGDDELEVAVSDRSAPLASDRKIASDDRRGKGKKRMG